MLVMLNLLSILPTFYDQLLYQVPFANKLQTQTVRTWKASKTFPYKKSCSLSVDEMVAFKPYLHFDLNYLRFQKNYIDIKFSDFRFYLTHNLVIISNRILIAHFTMNFIFLHKKKCLPLGCAYKRSVSHLFSLLSFSFRSHFHKRYWIIWATWYLNVITFIYSAFSRNSLFFLQFKLFQCFDAVTIFVLYCNTSIKNF